MKKHIYIFGASGSVTTTIAREVCKKLVYRHFDSDDYFWLPTARPFTAKRKKESYMNLPPNGKWILSGSITGWTAAYDSGERSGRSLAKHENWLKTVPCPVLRLENHDLGDSVEKVIKAIL